MKGRFITLEGIEGAGKSTHLNTLRATLGSRNIPVLTTREPGGTPLSETIRQWLLDPRQNICDDAELLLMFAARAQHLQHRIIPALKQGTWVLSDRFTDASFAYQGGGRGIAEQRIELLKQWVQGEFEPDVTLLLDVSPETGMARVGRRGKKDRFEQNRLEFFQRVRNHYLERAERFPQRFLVIDAEHSEHRVRQQLLTWLDAYVQP